MPCASHRNAARCALPNTKSSSSTAAHISDHARPSCPVPLQAPPWRCNQLATYASPSLEHSCETSSSCGYMPESATSVRVRVRPIAERVSPDQALRSGQTDSIISTVRRKQLQWLPQLRPVDPPQ